MATIATPQNTDFSRDILGRYVCNGLDEALASANAIRSTSSSWAAAPLDRFSRSICFIAMQPAPAAS